jgi:HEAT repeat protein
MTTKPAILTFIFILALSAGTPAHAQAPGSLPPGVANNFQPQSTGDSRADSLYDAGKKAIYSGEWQKALDSFSQLIKMGKQVDSSLYYQAYAQNKLGQRSEALTSIAELKRQYPRSPWLKDGKALEVEIDQAMGRTPHPEDQNDCELKMLAVNSLMNSDPNRAVPILEKFLNSSSSNVCGGKVNDKALFVLSQSDSPHARELMTQIASGKVHPEMQKRAINYIGISGGEGSHKELMEIYNSTNNPDAKKSVINTLGISGGTNELLALAKNERDPELVKRAINSLGVAGAREQLRQLYSSVTDPTVKREILRSAIVSGDSQLLENVALNDPDPKLKREAIQNMGVTGGSSTTLMKIYSDNRDKDVRDGVLNALFIKGDAHSLIELAKRETDPEWKKRIVEKLSVMGNREATDYLMEILNK